MAFLAKYTVCPLHSTVTQIFILCHKNKVMHKKRLEDKCRSQNGDRYLEECMSVGGNAQWKKRSIFSPHGINML